MADPTPLDYATPPAVEPSKSFGRRTSVIMGLGAIIMIAFGIWCIRYWQFGRESGGRIRKEIGERDLPIGIVSCVIGLLLLAVAAYLFLRAVQRETSRDSKDRMEHSK